MAAPRGNKFWMARTKHGRDKLFKSPEALREACCEYFQWCEDNPLRADKVGFYEGKATHEPEEKLRAFTLEGLHCFLADGITDQTWINWRSDKDFLGVVSWADRIIKNQKFSGAAAGLLNSNIIARDLGLSDKTDTQFLDKDGKPADASVNVRYID